MAAAPTLATVTPAIWGFVRTGFAAAAARAEDEVAAEAELVEDVDVDVNADVDVVRGVAISPTPPDAAFVVVA